MQEINTTVYDNIVGLYVQHSDEVYSNGVQNISHELSFDKALPLCATSHAIVCTIENTCVNCLLQIKTMMKHSALYLGVNQSLGRKRRVPGVTSNALLDKTSCHWCDLKCTLGQRGTYQRHDSSRVFFKHPHLGTKMCHHHGQHGVIIGHHYRHGPHANLGIDIHNSSKNSRVGPAPCGF
jgi:hypothetical protein